MGYFYSDESIHDRGGFIIGAVIYCESFNSKLRDELLNGEVFCTLQEARIVIESWRQHYNTVRPHSSLGYRPPAPEAFISSRPAAQPQSAPPGARSLASPPILN